MAKAKQDRLLTEQIGTSVMQQHDESHAYYQKIKKEAYEAYITLLHKDTSAGDWRFCTAPQFNWHHIAQRKKQPLIDLGNGIGLFDLADFMMHYPKLSQKYICDAQYNYWKQDLYSCLVHLGSTHAYVLLIPPHIHLHTCIALPTAVINCLALTTIYIIVQQGAWVIVHDEQWGSAVRSVICFIEPHAHIEYLHSNTYTMMQYTHFQYYLQQQSNLSWYGWYTKAIYNHMQVMLQGQQAQAKQQIGFLGNDDDLCWIKTMQYHKAKKTMSALMVKGLLQNAARAVHLGMIHIDEQATQSKASQESKHLLLSNQAQAHAMPSLQVLTHDVQCMHGSSIGSFDKQQLFYAHTRGLTYMQAKELLMRSFFSDLFPFALADRFF